MWERRLSVSIAIVVAALLALGLSWGLASHVANWHVIAGGGGHSEAGAYALDGTLGQPVVGLSSSTSNSLCAGFWCGTLAVAPTPPPTPRPVYLPLVRRGP